LAALDAAAPLPPGAEIEFPARLVRFGPIGLALILHAGLLVWLIWFTGEALRPESLSETSPSHVVTVELVQARVEPGPVPAETPAPAAPGDPVPSQDSPVSEPSAPAAAAPRAEPAAPAASTGAPDAVELDAAGGATVETAFATRSSALAGLACARAFGREAGTLGCAGDGSGDEFGFARYADGGGAAQIDAAVTAQFGALAGLYGAQLDPSLRRLPGQQGTAVFVNRRMGLSGADQMRDSLPPMVPDPAFGD